MLEDSPVEVGSLITLRLGRNAGVAFGLGDRLLGPLVMALTAAVTAVLGVVAARGSSRRGRQPGWCWAARSRTWSTG